MRDIVLRAIHARPQLAAELCRRGMFSPEEKAAILRYRSGELFHYLPLGSVQFATLLAQADSQFAAWVVRRNLRAPDELCWLDRLLRFQKHNGKRDELIRIVERALEGRTGNALKPW